MKALVRDRYEAPRYCNSRRQRSPNQMTEKFS